MFSLGIVLKSKHSSCTCAGGFFPPFFFVFSKHAPVLLKLPNHPSLTGRQNVITGSSKPLTATCWGAGKTQPLQNLINNAANIAHTSEEGGCPVWNNLHYIPRLRNCGHRRRGVSTQNGGTFFSNLSFPLQEFRGALPTTED